jgi:predicted ATPase/DNA-binding SARP family transcriptional activator
MDVRLLGPLVAEAHGVQAALGGPMQRAVLALLALQEGRLVSADGLVEALWGGQPPATASNTVQVYVSGLRKALAAAGVEGDTIVRDGSGYRLAIEGTTLDHVQFTKRVEEGEALLARGEAALAREVFADALGLWRGPALADFEYDNWAQPEARRLEELRVSCLEGRIEADLASGRASELVGELEARVEEHPVRERFTAHLMLALYRSGRQAEALEVYQRARERLVEALGIEPTRELQELNRRILNQDEALAGPERTGAPTVKLPTPPTPLVGRQRELAELSALLADDDVRLITLVGPGGVGKTRLALATASAAAARFPHGVFWVPLHALRDPGLVTSTIANVLGSDGELAGTIGQSRMLLALDNFEQVVDAAVDVAELIAACPRLTVLATSREPLHVAAEHEYPVAGLPETDAVALFNERARAIRPDLRANGEVTAICHRLDRLPLALELAAARVNVLPVEAILAKLDDRLGMLTRGARDLPERHQTLRETIAWSYQLLDEAEQQAFARLGVFAGGWTLEAAEAVCGIELDDLASLIDKCLVVRHEQHSAFEARYGMLETIREYATERLTEAEPDEETCRRHTDWFLDFAERAYPHLRGGESGAWLDRMEREHDNLRAALSFLLRGDDLERAVQLAGALSRFWMTHGHLMEGQRWLEDVLGRGGKQERRVRALRGLAILLMERGELERPEALAEEALELAVESGNQHEAARAAGLLADVAAYRDDMDTARERYEQAAEAARRAGDDREAAVNLYNLGHVARVQGDLDRADALFEETHGMFSELDDRVGQAGTVLGLAETAQLRGDEARIPPRLVRALELMLDVGYPGGIVDCLNLIGGFAADTGDPGRAAKVWGAASGLDEKIGRDAAHPSDAAGYNEALAAARAACGEETFDRLWAEGKQLSLEATAAYAFEGLEAGGLSGRKASDRNRRASAVDP